MALVAEEPLEDGAASSCEVSAGIGESSVCWEAEDRREFIATDDRDGGRPWFILLEWSGSGFGGQRGSVFNLGPAENPGMRQTCVRHLRE